MVQLRVAAQLRDNLSLQALRRLKLALDVDAIFATVSFGVTADNEVVYLGPAGHREAAKRPGQIIMTFDVPLRDIRSDLHERIISMRKRRGIGKVVRRKGVLANQPRISGTRISTDAIARLSRDGWSHERILEEYPELEAADIRAALRPKRRAG